MASTVILEATLSPFFHAVWTVLVCILLVLAELFAVALLVAPRAVLRKLWSLLRAGFGRVWRAPSLRQAHRHPAHPSGGGT
jgi:hypothetical protein